MISWLGHLEGHNVDDGGIAWENCLQFEVTHDREHLHNDKNETPALLSTKSFLLLPVPASCLTLGCVPLALIQCRNIIHLCHVHVYHRCIYMTFFHHYQGSIDFNTVNIHRTVGMYFLVSTGNRGDIE